MRQNRQRGYVVIYVIVGIILAAIALATLYGLRQLSAQNQAASSTENAATGEQQKETNNTKPDDKSADKKKNEKSDEKKDTSSAESNKSAQQQPQQHAQNQPTPPAQNNSRGSSRLPATGPADSLAVGFVLGLIVAAGFAYRRSMLVV